LDSVANNLANVNTSGFRAERNQFKSIMAKATATGSSPLNLAVNNYGVLGGTSLDLTSGSIKKTGNDLDLAINGSGFFTVQTKAGQVYTRNGEFQVSSTGELVTSSGDAVLGDKGPINISGGKVDIGSDGTISVDGAAVGKLKIVDFPAATQLTPMGSTYFTAPQNAETDATQSTIEQGAIEASNVNPVSSAVELINIQREAEMMQRTVTMFSSDLDKTATEDLPRVTS
jgi:flagellar basal-body rod protein FlgF/flagellar basal-body rod protein FlgG